jgi:hypothetical protein
MVLIDGDCYGEGDITPIGGSGDVVHVQTPFGGGNVTLDNALQLRATGMLEDVSSLETDEPQPGGPTHTTGDAAAAVSHFTFFIYDHLGNSSI